MNQEDSYRHSIQYRPSSIYFQCFSIVAGISSKERLLAHIKALLRLSPGPHDLLGGLSKFDVLFLSQHLNRPKKRLVLAHDLKQLKVPFLTLPCFFVWM